MDTKDLLADELGIPFASAALARHAAEAIVRAIRTEIRSFDPHQGPGVLSIRASARLAAFEEAAISLDAHGHLVAAAFVRGLLREVVPR